MVQHENWDLLAETLSTPDLVCVLICQTEQLWAKYGIH